MILTSGSTISPWTSLRRSTVTSTRSIFAMGASLPHGALPSSAPSMVILGCRDSSTSRSPWIRNGRPRRSATWLSIGPLSQFQSNRIRTPMSMTATAASAPKIRLRRLLTDRVRSSAPTPKRADGCGRQASRRLVFCTSGLDLLQMRVTFRALRLFPGRGSRRWNLSRTIALSPRSSPQSAWPPCTVFLHHWRGRRGPGDFVPAEP